MLKVGRNLVMMIAFNDRKSILSNTWNWDSVVSVESLQNSEINIIP